MSIINIKPETVKASVGYPAQAFCQYQFAVVSEFYLPIKENMLQL